MIRPAHPLRVLLGALTFLVVLVLPGLAQQPAFEVERLNPGLPAPPDSVHRDTPRSAMESLGQLIETEDFDAAAHLFDLSDIAPEKQPEMGARLARQFAIVLERQVLVPWNDLSDRPDGWIDGSDKEPGTGRVRRSIRLSLLEGEDHPIPLRLNRLKPEGGNAVWVISAQSVRAIPRLYERFKPTALERAMPEALRDRGPMGMYYWEWLLLPGVIALALLLGVIAYRITGWLGGLSNRRFVQSIVRAFRWPVTIAIVAFVIAFATSRLFVVTGPVSVVIQPMVLLGYIIAAALAAVLVADEVFDRVSLNNPADLAQPENAHRRSLATLISGIRKFVIVIAVILGAITLLGSIEVFNSLGYTLLAGAGAVTLVLGFAAREVLGNLLAAVQIALNRSARIGDLIVFEGQFCTVERIHFTYVQLLIWTGNRYIVPVSDFVSKPFENLSAGDHAMTRPVIVTLHQDADVQALRDAFPDILDEIDDGTLGDRDKVFVAVTEQDIFGKKVLFAVPTPDQSTFWTLECAAREAIIARAAAIAADTGRPMLPETPARDLPQG